MKRMLYSLTFVTVCVILVSCYHNSNNWPPPRLTSPPLGFVPDANLNFHNWVNLQTQMAFIVNDGKIRLPYNLFAITETGTEYAESQCEVIYYDEQQTLIIADSTKKDKILLLNMGKGDYSFSCPGTRVRYQNKIYELKKDGWYVEGEIVHAFQANKPK